MNYIYGKIYHNGRFKPGYIGFDEGEIKVHGKQPSVKIRNRAMASGLIIPTLYNAHVHLADSFMYGQYCDTPLEKLIGPKTGIKIKKLKNASDRTVVTATRDTVLDMLYSGTSTFIDFRELGLRGLRILKRSMKNLPVNYITLGRPDKIKFDAEELDSILELADGIGLSAHRDWPPKTIGKIAKRTHQDDKLFALHVSEAEHEDIDTIIDLEPDFIVHLLKATRRDLDKIAQQEIPVVVCPRANMFFGRYPNITDMIDADIKLMLGTDNAMLTKPDMLSELEYAFRCAKLTGGITPKTLMEIAFDNPRSFFEPEIDNPSCPLEVGKSANFMVMNVPRLNTFAHPENLLCLGLSRTQIDLISMERFIWRRLK